MASVIPFRPAAAAPRRGAALRLLDAIAGAARRELARRELSRLDDRLLRDVGLCPEDVRPSGDPSRAARPAGRASRLLRQPGA